MIKYPKSCPACGGSSLTWDTNNVTYSGVQNGRLKTNEVTCLFFLGCDECSATVFMINADMVTKALNDELKATA